MTKDKDFKNAVRRHMAATGLSYTAAREELERSTGPTASSPGGHIPTDARIFVTGHGGLVGGALLRKLEGLRYSNLLVATRDQLDLRDQAAVNYWFRANRPEYVFLVAGTVGGIGANSQRPADFLYDNMMIHATVVHAAHTFGVKKLLYLGSSCIYPRAAAQPITEDQLLTGPLEPTNEGYALAKIAGLLRDIVHPGAELVFDTTKPDGMPRKVLDVSRIHRLGWHHHIGLASTYEWFTMTGNIRSAAPGAAAVTM